MESAERVKYFATLIVTGAWKGTSRNSCMLNWDEKVRVIVDGVGVSQFVKSTINSHRIICMKNLQLADLTFYTAIGILELVDYKVECF